MKRVIGVDVGGTGIKLGAVEVNDSPELLADRVIHGHASLPVEDVLRKVEEEIRRLLETAGWDAPDGIGVGSAGLVHSQDGVVVTSPNLPRWKDAPIGPRLAEAMGVPARVDNDVNAFALAEWRWGAGKGTDDVVFLTLGTGIGGAVITGGALLRGKDGFAGEPGHATLVLGGIPCPCGNEGCAERYVGNQGIVDAARAHPEFGKDERLATADPLTPKVLHEAAQAGSAVATTVLADAGRALGGLLVTLVNLMNPARIVIGGGVAQAGDYLLGPARDHLARRSLVARHAPVEVVPAALGEHAGILGAAAVFLDESLDGAR